MKNYSVSLDPELIESKRKGNDDFSLSAYLQKLIARDCADDDDDDDEIERGDIPVYEGDDLIARVSYTNNLDVWDGRNWSNGGTGRHLGITVLRSGQYVLIAGSDWQGERDSAAIVAPKTALKAVCDSENTELLNEPRFLGLRKLYESAQCELEPDEVPPAPAPGAAMGDKA